MNEHNPQLTVIDETCFLHAVAWWCAFARASDPLLRQARLEAMLDEDTYEIHADGDLVGHCDCDACYRHRVRCAQREDREELTESGRVACMPEDINF